MGDANCEDRISKLPDTLILHILSFLPTQDVVPTCVLSKRWKFLWYSVPIISFSDVGLEQITEQFYNFINKYLEHRKKGMYFITDSVITKFKLDNCHYQSDKDDILDKCLAFVAENKVKKMYFRISPEYYDDQDIDDALYYCLPKKWYNSARYLTIMELRCVELNVSCSFSFPFLKTLSLKKVQQSYGAKHDAVLKFLLGCPSLKKLRLLEYKFLCINKDQLRLQSLSLKFLELKFLQFKYPLQVETINLESLDIAYGFFERINFSSCKKIRNLSLFNFSKLSSLEALICEKPLLANLFLKITGLSSDYHLRFSSQHLKSFTFEEPFYSRGLIHIEIESAPRLEYFDYEGSVNFSISMKSSNCINGNIVIRDEEKPFEYDTKWCIDMINFLMNLKCNWNIVTLHVSSYKAFIWPENLKKICRYPLLNWKRLKVITDCPPEKESELKDALMWISPSLETLSINKKDLNYSQLLFIMVDCHEPG